MRHSVRRWLFGAGAVAAVGAFACGQGIAGAASAGPAGHEVTAATAMSANMVTAKAAAAAAAAYVPPAKALYVGQQGAAVKSVQQRLAQLHYYPGPIDGRYGSDLLEAAWAFREVQGLRMNATTAAEPISKTFESALINPRQPYSRYPGGPANRIEINQNIQVLVLYKSGKPSLIIHVSTGGGYYYQCPHSTATCGPAITPDGRYTALSFASGWIKVPLGTMYNPVFFIGRAYAIHGDIPVPWYPASHGCVRIWMDVAPWLHRQVSIGGPHPTVIYVYGKAPYYL